MICITFIIVRTLILLLFFTSLLASVHNLDHCFLAAYYCEGSCKKMAQMVLKTLLFSNPNKLTLCDIYDRAG